jgi:flagellar protein FlaG
MLIQNVSNTTQASPPIKPASDGAPNVAVATSSNVAAQPNVTASQSPAPAEAKQATEKKQAVAAAQLQNVVENINKALKQSNKNLEFTIDGDTNRSVVKLVDSETGDVIRQFPSEEMLAISKAVSQMQERLQQASLQQAALVKGQAQSTQGLLVKQQD